MNSGLTERELRVAEAMAEWPPMSAAQRESTPLNNESSIYINFIDEDGEVSQLQTTKNEGTSYLFDRYARQYHTPFLLSRVMHEFRYNGELIPLNVTIGSILSVGGDVIINAIVYVTTRLPSRTDFNNKIVPNIPGYVKYNPRCFINQKVLVITGDESSVLCTVNDYSIDTGSFIIKYSGGDTLGYDQDQFIRLLQDYYSNSNLNGFTHDIKMYLTVLWSICKTQVDKLDPNQSLDKPNAIILRMIKIRQQIYRVLNFIHEATDQDEWGKWEIHMFNYFSGKLGEDLTSLADKEKSNLSNFSSLHKVNKPLFELEERVWVKCWPNNDKTLKPSWELGTIKSFEEHEDIDGYGPRRVYIVKFNNRDLRTDVEDYQVIPDENYIEESELESWRGVKHVVDKDSSDQWAREVGWFTVEIDGSEEPFVYQSDAIEASKLRNDAELHHVEYGMLQSLERLSDPIMRRICRILIPLILHGVDSDGHVWKTAQGQWNDCHANQLRDSVYKLALSKQRKIFGSVSDGLGLPSVDGFEELCRFFISSEGCLDTFLLKVPIFCQGYDTIPSEYNSAIPPESDDENNFYSRHHEVFGYLNNNVPDDADEYMSIKFVDGKETERYIVRCDKPFKELLTNYAYYNDTSIKSIRIKHKNRMIFLSSIGKKLPEQLSIADADIIEVTIIQSTPTETSIKEQPKQNNTKKNNKKKHKKSKKKRAQPQVIQKPEVELKVEHSKLLGKVYEEAEPTFKEIRQRLNALNLERTKPKQKRIQPKTTESVEVVDNPLDDGQLGGKAGKTQFIIQVGEVSNLYKTTKPSSRGRRQDDTLIDLHGLTAEEAVYRLDKHLPDWIETFFPTVAT